MQIKEFVAQVKHQIKDLKSKSQIESHKKDLVYIENNRAVAELEKLLKKKSFSNGEVDHKNLLSFIHLIANRWDIIEDTNAVFSNTLANKLHDALGRELQNLGYQKNKLLRYKLKIENADDVDLNRVVPSDDNETYIDVLECLQKAKVNGGKLIHTHPHRHLKEDYLEFLPAKKDQIELSNSEKDRVINFNIAANKFYHAILEHDKNKIRQRENALIKSFGSKPITANYGDDGQNRLAQRLFHNSDELIESLNSNGFSFKERADLLNGLSLQTLNKIVLNDAKDIKKELDNRVQSNSSYNETDEHDQTMALIYAAIRVKYYASRPNEFNTLLGWASGYAIPKAIVMKVGNIIFSLLSEPVKLSDVNEQAKKYINNDETLSPSQKKLCLKALQQGTTGEFVKQLQKVSKFFQPEQEAPKAHRWF